MAKKKITKEEINKETKEKQENSQKTNSEDPLELLREIAMIVGGKNAGLAVDLLIAKKHVNEFIVAKKLELTINQTRNILYKLADEGLVSSIRKKDKKKGWYTYFWIFNSDKAYNLLNKNMMKDVEQLEHQLKSREVKQFYTCPVCHYEITEDTALLHDFTCQECGEIYQIKDNTQTITEIKSQIAKLRKRIEYVDSEIVIIEGKKVKKLERETKKLEKEKAAKRKLAAEARRKIKQALNKGKKVVKKVKKKAKKSAKKKAKKSAKKKATKKVVKKKKKVVKKKRK